MVYIFEKRTGVTWKIIKEIPKIFKGLCSIDNLTIPGERISYVDLVDKFNELFSSLEVMRSGDNACASTTNICSAIFLEPVTANDMVSFSKYIINVSSCDIDSIQSRSVRCVVRIISLTEVIFILYVL